MSFSFSVGSIYAEMQLRTDDFRKAIKTAEELARRGAAIVGKVFDKVGIKIPIAPLKESLKTVTDVVHGFVPGVSKELRESGLHKLGIAEEDVKKNLDKALVSVKDFGSKVGGVLTDVGTAIAGTRMFRPLVTGARTAAEVVGENFREVGADITRGFTVAATSVGRVWTGLTGKLAPVWSAIRGKATAAAGSIKTVFSGIGSEIARDFSQIGTAFSTAINSLGASKLAPLFAAIKAGGVAAFSVLTASASLFGRVAALTFIGLETAALAAFRIVAAGAGQLGTVMSFLGKQIYSSMVTAFSLAGKAIVPIISGITAGLAMIPAAVSTAFSVAGKAVSLLLSPLKFLKNQLFSLRGLIAGFAAFKFIERANEVETITVAFRSLSSAIGLFSDELLGKTRAALRGTVSDLEIMRATNNAMLLGIVKTNDQWAELVAGAKRLGRAVGRDTVDALNDITVGVGRMSRLILDNIGLIVKVGEATDSYAKKLGVTALELTDVQRREAFLFATTEAIRVKMRQLGPELDSNADAWSQLRASLSNFFSDVSVALSGSKFPMAFAAFLDSARRPVAAFAKLLSNLVGNLVDVIGRMASEVKRGKNTIGAIFEDVYAMVKIGIAGAWDIAWEAFKVGVSAIAKPVADVLAALLKKILAEVLTPFAKQIGKLLSLGDLDVQMTRALASGGGELANAANKYLDAVAEKRGQALLKTLGILETEQKTLASSVNEAFAEMTREVTTGGSKIGAVITRVMNELSTRGGRVGEALGGGVSAAIQRFTHDLQVNLLELGDLKVDRWIQPIADQFNRLVVQIDSYIERLPTLRAGLRALESEAVAANAGEEFSAFQSSDRFSDQQIRTQTRGLVDTFREVVLGASSAATAVRKFLAPKVLGEELIDKIAPFRDELKKMREELESVGLDEPIAKFKLMEKAIAALMARTTDPDERRQLTEFMDSFKKTSELLSAAKAADEIRKKLEELDHQIVKLEQDSSGVSLEQLVDQLIQARAEVMALWDSAPEGERWKVLERLDRLQVALAKKADVGIVEELQKLDVELRKAGESDLTKRLIEWEDKLQKVEKEFGSNAVAVKALRDGLSKLTGREWILKFASNLDQAQATLEEMQFRIKHGDISGPEADIARIDDLVATAATKNLTDSERAFVEKAKKLRGELQAALGGLEFGALGREVFTTVASSFADAFSRGEKLSKGWASAVSAIFSNAMSKAIESVGKMVETTLSKIFSSLGAGAGLAGLATSLIGIGAMILSNLSAKAESTTDDFDSAVTQSEAVRGVVAGPTDVAIAKIGENLKTALWTTEGLLERIARAVEGGVGLSSGGSSRNMAYALSGSQG